MPGIRVRFVAAATVLAVPVLFGFAFMHPATASGENCTDPTTDSDVEYAGDNDIWCGASAPSVSPAGAPSPMPTASAVPAPAASPSVSPSTSGTPCPAPGVFPTAFFGPGLAGPITRPFTSQYVTDYGSYVETCYPAGSSAPSSGVPGGAQAKLAMAVGAADDATLSYQIRFPVGTQWVKGGKLPGLCGGLCWTGSNNGPGGWCARFMWRTGGAGEVLINDATTTGYGTDLGLGSWYFRADGNWHSLAEHVHMNTPGAADGYIDVTYDSVLVAHLAGITFRTDASTHIDSLMFSTFYGGHDSTWAPTQPQRFDFTAFNVTP